MTDQQNPRRLKRGTYQPKNETLALLKVSGNPLPDRGGLVAVGTLGHGAHLEQSTGWRYRRNRRPSVRQVALRSTSRRDARKRIRPMAGPPIGTQEPRSQSPKAPCRLGLAEWEAHVVLVERWKEYWVRNVRFSHFLPDLYKVNCCCKNSRFSPLG